MTDASETPTLSSDLTDEFTLRFDGEEREIVMKFALLRELARLLPGANDTQMVFHDEYLFEQVLISLLIPRNERGKPIVQTDPQNGEEIVYDLDDHDFDEGAAVRLVKWAMEHLIGFFLNKLTAVTTLGDQNVGQIEALLSSLPGLKALASKKASAGPTDFNSLVSPNSTGPSPTETSAPI